MRAFLVFAATVAAVAMAQHSKNVTEPVWEDMFAPPYTAVPEIVLSIDCPSKDLCYVPGGSNGQGFGMYKWNGQMNGALTQMNEPNMTMMIMTVHVGGTAAAPKGAFAGMGMFSLSKEYQYLANGGNTWLPSNYGLEFIQVTQSMDGTADGNLLVGLASGVAGNQLMVSTDGGKTFTPKPFNGVDFSNNCTEPGYISVVDANTWYMTAGSFPPSHNSGSGSQSQSASSSMGRHVEQNDEEVSVRVKQHITLTVNKKTKKVSRRIANLHKLSQESGAEGSGSGNGETCGYLAYIYKTTNAGASWEKVFDAGANPGYTFNNIKCHDATHCVVVGGGYADTATPGANVFTTTNGRTFTKTLELPATQTTSIGINAAAYRTATEVWAAGGSDTQTSGNGVFYVSHDSGMSWLQYSMLQPNIMQLMDVTFTPDGTGFANGITMFRTSTLLKYANQPFYGYFQQLNCPFAGCTFMCQAITFPQGMCLGTNGGSAKAFCTAQGLKQEIYTTTSCVGTPQIINQPVNTCLNGTDGSFFENLCNTQTPHAGGSATGVLKH